MGPSEDLFTKISNKFLLRCLVRKKSDRRTDNGFCISDALFISQETYHLSMVHLEKNKVLSFFFL
jgi:hypothetical protein